MRPVDERAPICLTVMVEPDVEPIRGTVWRGRQCVPFCGWLELSAAIEHARDADEPVGEIACRP
jgi:hypothetical protein